MVTNSQSFGKIEVVAVERNTTITRVEFFLGFAVIFLRPMVIPLIPPIIFWEPPMRRYRRNSVENWGWPTLFLKDKPFLPAISHKKGAGKIFYYCCRKKRTQSENQISSQDKRKTLRCFSFENGGYGTPKSLPRKVSEKSGKNKLHTKKRPSVPSSSTLSMKRNIFQELDSRFLSFWLASWGGPILTLFAINVERQRRKNDWRNSSIIYKGCCIHQPKNVCGQEHCPISLPQSRTH